MHFANGRNSCDCDEDSNVCSEENNAKMQNIDTIVVAVTVAVVVAAAAAAAAVPVIHCCFVAALDLSHRLIERTLELPLLARNQDYTRVSFGIIRIHFLH